MTDTLTTGEVEVNFNGKPEKRTALYGTFELNESAKALNGTHRTNPDFLNSALLHPACLLPVLPCKFGNDYFQCPVELGRFLLWHEVPGTGDQHDARM